MPVTTPITPLSAGRQIASGYHFGPEGYSLAKNNRSSPCACTFCGSVLDAPRVDPLSGRLGRKCGECSRWRPL